MSGFIGGLGLSAIPSALPHPGIRTGTNYYISPTQTSSATTATPASDRAYYVPFILPGMAIDRVGLETTVGAGNARVGFYTNLNGLPDQLILDAGILDISGVAINEITLSPTLYLPNAWVWGCIVYSGTPTVRAGGAITSAYIIGVPTPSSANTRSLVANLNYGPLPAQASVVGVAASTIGALMLLRKT